MVDVPKDNAFAADTVIYWQNRAFTLEDDLNKLGQRIVELEAQVDDLTSENNRLERAWLAINKRCHGYEIELGIRKPDAALQEDK